MFLFTNKNIHLLCPINTLFIVSPKRELKEEMNKLLPSLLIAICIGFYTIGFGQTQETQYIENELLIQVKSAYLEEELMAEINGLAKVDEFTLLSKHVHIWQLKFKGEPLDLLKLKRKIGNLNGVETVQLNHLVELRNQPNDPNYSSQWQHFNAGSPGLLDADIDTEEAWDITTGGLTANGDTIVVAIIDDGLDDTHPDFEENLWFNYNEIPNNGIDDDGNGYIDDYKGWNVDNNDDDIAGGFWGGGHGTPVAGIVGAKGDNGVGVAGVNWAVKLMIIVGGPNEARAIQSYDYALQNRLLYQETFGAKGAFVVATNSSWGINFGQPSQSPLWCAFYDTLGVHGILSAGATINDNQNVDAIGDLPTACPSEYMIAVTNMDKYDNKVTFAGYGTSTIDLGAPGEGTYTTSAGSQLYDTFGGTSGATPHVAGAIALIYSVQCTKFADLAITEPNVAAIKARDYIFNTVDSIPDLSGVTVTEGRLNVHQAILRAVDSCDATLGINNADLALKINLYPNPSNAYIDVITDLKLDQYSIYNQQGQIVQMASNLNANQRIDISNLGAGMYFFSATADDHTYQIKFIKN
jgi:subtilisin family serine protease